MVIDMENGIEKLSLRSIYANTLCFLLYAAMYKL